MSIVINYKGANIQLNENQWKNSENFTDMSFSEIMIIIEMIMDCYEDKEEIPDKSVIQAMDIINELDSDQHNLQRPMFELTKRLRTSMKKSVSHEVCVKTLILPMLIKSCRIWNRDLMFAEIPKEVDSIILSCNDDTIKYIKFVLSNLQIANNGNIDECHRKIRNKVNKIISILHKEIHSQKKDIGNYSDENIRNAFSSRIKYVISLFDKEENEKKEEVEKKE